MADVFLQLSAEDRRDALGVAADRLGRPTHLLEKDVWVVWALATLYAAPLGEHLVFKGGTSLSKAYQVIRRFSEDVDLTYDIRAIAPDLVGDNGEGLPKTRSEEKRWSSEVRRRLPGWVAETVQPVIANALAAEGLAAAIRVEDDKLFIDYEATAAGSGYVAPSVMLEFGARSTGEPASLRDVSCDAADAIDGLFFPTARPRVMHAERTFWEKATAIHVFCLQERLRGDRFARHWHDVVRLDEAGFAEAAFADRELANAVARHKSMFFAEKAADRTPIDYAAAVNGGLQLVPVGDGAKALKDDYARMVEDGLLFDDAEPFEALMAQCADIAAREQCSQVRNWEDRGYMSEVEEERKFQFLRNGDAEPSELDWSKGIESARQAISEAMNAKNIAFLLGAGCSSLMKDKKELGIATMAPLAKEFCGETLQARAAGFYSDPPTEGAAPAPWRLTKGELDYLDALGIDLAKDYSRNLERLMEVLFAQRFVLRQSENPDLHPYRTVLDGIIKKVQDFLWTRVTQGAFATEGDTTVRDLYERFYKKLVLRDRSLPRPWVFTTNYDHFSELAMDRLPATAERRYRRH